MTNIKQPIPKAAHKAVRGSSNQKLSDTYSSRDSRDENRSSGGNRDPNIDKGRKANLRSSGEQKHYNNFICKFDYYTHIALFYLQGQSILPIRY